MKEIKRDVLKKINLNKLRILLKKKDDIRELIIKESREPLKNSKKAVYEVHRRNKDKAFLLLKKSREKINFLFKKSNEDNRNILANAIEEYIEARLFYEFIFNKDFLKFDIIKKELKKVKIEEYLSGIADFTGELVRKAVNLGIEKDKKGVLFIKEVVEKIYGEMIEIDFRNNELRRKFDSIKYNLQKIEKILYDLEIYYDK